MLYTKIIKRFSQNIQQIQLGTSISSQQTIQKKDQGHFQYIPSQQKNSKYQQNHQVKQQSRVKTINPSTALDMQQIPLSTSTFENVKNIYDFAKLVGELKALKRTGWTHFAGIKDVESVADHSWRMSLLCMLFMKDKSINFERCIKFSIIHDLAEVIVGDITPRDGISEDKKHVMEDEGIQKILLQLQDEEIRNELYSIWKQYEDRQCPESKLVKDMDRYEMMLQAFEYEQKYPGVDLSEFLSDSGKITHPVVKSWLQELLGKRAAYKEQLKNK